MEKIIEFIGNNYAWFLTITIILLFALIGYIYDNRKIKEEKSIDKEEKNDILIEEEKISEVKNDDPVKLEQDENVNKDIETQMKK